MDLRDIADENPNNVYVYLIVEVEWTYNDNWHERTGLVSNNNKFDSFEEARKFCDKKNFEFLSKSLPDLNNCILYSPSFKDQLKDQFPDIFNEDGRYKSPLGKIKNKDWFVHEMSNLGFCKYEILQLKVGEK